MKDYELKKLKTAYSLYGGTIEDESTFKPMWEAGLQHFREVGSSPTQYYNDEIYLRLREGKKQLDHQMEV